MTAPRRFGEDSPFNRWLRGEPDLDSHANGITVNDCDLLVHKYRTRQCGKRVHLKMLVEVKTRSAMPSDVQRETLFDWHNCAKSKRRRLSAMTGKVRAVWNFGVFVLCLSGTDPTDSARIEWCQFDDVGELHPVAIDRETLIRLLRFDIAPDNFSVMTSRMRLHHKKSELRVVQRMPLGFEVEVLVRRSS